MSDTSAREWRFYLDDMIGFAEKVIAYTNGFDQAGFVASGLGIKRVWVSKKPQHQSHRVAAN